jgi:TPR repeat protein
MNWTLKARSTCWKSTFTSAVDVLIVLADLYSKAGNPEKEIELLRRSVAEGEPNALHNLGLALWESGQTREGKALLKKAAQQGDKLSPKVLHNLRGKQRHIRLK